MVSKFTKKHYIFIAKVIKNAPISQNDKTIITHEFIKWLKEDNIHFMQYKFGEECGIYMKYGDIVE